MWNIQLSLRERNIAEVLTGHAAQVELAFLEAFTILDRRINLFLSLPLASRGRDTIQNEIDQIGGQ